MSLYQFENTVIGNAKKTLKPGQRLTIRRQQCVKCSSILALEITDKPGHGGDYYVAKSGLWIKGEFRILYDKERWFGKRLMCPRCGRIGNLPMDKPLNLENMEKTREGKDAKSSNLN